MARKRKRVKGPAGGAGGGPGVASAVEAVLPADAGAVGDADQGAAPGPASDAGADAGELSSPALPPDPGGAPGGDPDGAPGGDPAGAHGEDETARQGRVFVLVMAFKAGFRAIPAHAGGGELSPGEAQQLAEAWELPLRPYWSALMGPWMGALLTTLVVVGSRVAVARQADPRAAE